MGYDHSPLGLLYFAQHLLLSVPWCLALCQAWSLCSNKSRSHWCRYWPLWGAAVQVAALARSSCGQTQKHKHQGVWPHGPSPETIRLRPVLLLDAIQTPSQEWPRKHSGTHLLRQSSGTGWECLLNIYSRGPLRLVTQKRRFIECVTLGQTFLCKIH